jgi:hypothetical protein
MTHLLENTYKFSNLLYVSDFLTGVYFHAADTPNGGSPVRSAKGRLAPISLSRGLGNSMARSSTVKHGGDAQLPSLDIAHDGT